MDSPILFDIAILIILVVFTLRGAYRGLILSLCGLVAVAVAFIGASLVADAAAPAVAKYLEPKFAAAIEERLEEQFQSTPSTGDIPAADATDEPPLQDVLNVLKDMGLYEDLVATIEQAVDQGMTEVAAGAAAAVAAAISRTVAHMAIFLLVFVIILILWTVLSHALDLVARLPGLNTLNRAGGALIGLLKGCILLFLCAWALRFSGNLFPEETVAKTTLLQFFLHTNPLKLLLDGSISPSIFCKNSLQVHI